ncbi:cupin domain-containing protein [Bosea thiooxidans]
MTDTKAYARTPALDNSQAYLGSVMSFLVEGKQTNGRLAMTESRSRPGSEPPPHIHEWEDELYHILDGAIDVFAGDEIIRVEKGGYAFVPKGVAHTFRIVSDELRMIVIVSATDERPVGLDGYFAEMGEPATSMELPKEAETYATLDPAHAIAAAARYGTRILSPAEAESAIPALAADATSGGGKRTA